MSFYGRGQAHHSSGVISLGTAWLERNVREDIEALLVSIEQGLYTLALLGQRLILVQQLLAFYATEVIEPNWHELERRLRSADTVDQVMKDHFDFLNTCRKECMLTDYRYLEVR